MLVCDVRAVALIQLWEVLSDSTLPKQAAETPMKGTRLAILNNKNPVRRPKLFPTRRALIHSGALILKKAAGMVLFCMSVIGLAIFIYVESAFLTAPGPITWMFIASAALYILGWIAAVITRPRGAEIASFHVTQDGRECRHIDTDVSNTRHPEV